MDPIEVDLFPSEPTPRGRTAKHRSRVWIAAGVLVMAGLIAVLAATSDGGSGKGVDSGSGAQSASSPTTTASYPVSSSYVATASGGSSVGSLINTTAIWVLQSCLNDNGFAPGNGSVLDMTKAAVAYRACRDFLPPTSVPADQAKMYDCLRANGIDADPRMPTMPVPLAVAKAAVAACSATVPAGSGPPPSQAGFVKCMEDHGAIISMPIQVEGVDYNAAARDCAPTQSQPQVPAAIQAYWDCLNAHGLNITLPVAPSTASTDVPAATITATARACRSLRPDSGSNVDYVDCMEDHGMLTGAPLAPSADRATAAGLACQSKQPAPTYPPGWTDYGKCLNDNGLNVALPGPVAPEPVSAEPAAVTAAAHACRSLRPSGPPAAYADCMEDAGVIVAIPLSMKNVPSNYASCSNLLPQMSQPPVGGQYEKCLNDHGLAIDPKGKPNYDQARAAFKACESLAGM